MTKVFTLLSAQWRFVALGAAFAMVALRLILPTQTPPEKLASPAQDRFVISAEELDGLGPARPTWGELRNEFQLSEEQLRASIEATLALASRRGRDITQEEAEQYWDEPVGGQNGPAVIVMDRTPSRR